MKNLPVCIKEKTYVTVKNMTNVTTMPQCRSFTAGTKGNVYRVLSNERQLNVPFIDARELR